MGKRPRSGRPRSGRPRSKRHENLIPKTALPDQMNDDVIPWSNGMCLRGGLPNRSNPMVKGVIKNKGQVPMPQQPMGYAKVGFLVLLGIVGIVVGGFMFVKNKDNDALRYGGAALGLVGLGVTLMYGYQGWKNSREVTAVKRCVNAINNSANPDRASSSVYANAAEKVAGILGGAYWLSHN